ncbi:MAG: hypothetical protein L6R41_000455 [Letrouitia leprolyta]|nr:MAG: hypothetical protein L6R41_000455 [Letrouitia leprolyta]
MLVATHMIDAAGPVTRPDISPQLGNETLQITLPNPYPVAGTPFSLDFDDSRGQGESLTSTAVSNCLGAISHEVYLLIRHSGNRPVSNRGYRIGELELDIISAHEPPGAVTYQDFMGILRALSRKMSREGYRARYADIIMTDGGEVMGDVQISSAEATGADSDTATA